MKGNQGLCCWRPSSVKDTGLYASNLQIQKLHFILYEVITTEQFRYFGTTLTNQNSIQEEIKSRLRLGNAGYQSV